VTAPVIEATRLRKDFVSAAGPPWRRRQRVVRAVDDVTFAVGDGHVVGLVGESGCGKTTVGNLVVDLLTPTSGEVRFHGQALEAMSPAQRLDFRRRTQIIFQDPYASLDPRFTLYQVVTEGYDIHGLHTAAERLDRADRLLELVGLDGSYGERYPHELSGGQRQRVAIARALSMDPQVLIADEPTSALDVSVKAQIVNLLEEIRERIGLAMLFISHDLSVVRHLCERVVVMHGGRVVESAGTDELFERPMHPYTRVLLEAIPVPNPRHRRRRRSRDEHRAAAQELLGTAYRVGADDGGKLVEVRPDNWVRCHPAGKD
jgi:oligopeptide transport system ATP-binding protein